MSRIGKQPVVIPEKVKVAVNAANNSVLVEGPKGKVQKSFAPVVKIDVADKKVTFAPTEDTRFSWAMYGTARSVVAGMVKGVTDGYSKELEIQGVGFKAVLKGKQLDLALGYSHPILFDIPRASRSRSRTSTKLKVEGVDKQFVGAGDGGDPQLTIRRSRIRARVSASSASSVRRKEGKTVA
jgi:large subunit ribosomal protein L6